MARFIDQVTSKKHRQYLLDAPRFVLIGEDLYGNMLPADSYLVYCDESNAVAFIGRATEAKESFLFSLYNSLKIEPEKTIHTLIKADTYKQALQQIFGAEKEYEIRKIVPLDI